MSVRIICINDKEKPTEVPKGKWVKEQEIYHILMVFYSIPSKTMAYSLEEIELDESCAPYEFFNAGRFAIRADDLEKFQELVKKCTELNDVEIEELARELELVERE